MGCHRLCAHAWGGSTSFLPSFWGTHLVTIRQYHRHIILAPAHHHPVDPYRLLGFENGVHVVEDQDNSIWPSVCKLFTTWILHHAGFAELACSRRFCSSRSLITSKGRCRRQTGCSPITYYADRAVPATATRSPGTGTPRRASFCAISNLQLNQS